VAYSLEIHDRVRLYLANHPALTRQDRVKLCTAINDLRDHGDSFRQNPDRRLAPGSPHFWTDYVMRCGDGVIRRFWFVVNDEAEVYGVLRVVYVDEGGPGPSVTGG